MTAKKFERTAIEVYLQMTTGLGIEAADDALTAEVRVELCAFNNEGDGEDWYTLEEAAETFGLTVHEYAATLNAVDGSDRVNAETEMTNWLTAAGIAHELQEEN